MQSVRNNIRSNTELFLLADIRENEGKERVRDITEKKKNGN